MPALPASVTALPRGTDTRTKLSAEGAGFVRVRWGREDSNLRRLSRRVYSPFPLAARAHPRGGASVAAVGAALRRRYGVSVSPLEVFAHGPGGLSSDSSAAPASSRSAPSSPD